MFLPRPRAYIDWLVPIDEDGKEVGVCTDENSLHHYLQWLAVYLFNTDIPVPASQQGLLNEYKDKGADYAVLDLSDCLGYSTWDSETVEELSANATPFAEYHATEVKEWNKLSPEEKQDLTDDEVFTSHGDYVRLGKERVESRKVPSHIQHANIPYRAVLAALFKGVPDGRKRYELLYSFYRNFNECASK